MESAIPGNVQQKIFFLQGGGTSAYLTFPGDFHWLKWNIGWNGLSCHSVDRIKAGTVDVKFLDTTVAAMLRTKFSLGLFESMVRFSLFFQKLL